ncbi:ABC transporter ATP-binding protein [Pelagibacterium montanilacus]|uniref:ABC transporter ATP-binding protein n=1 Tax=Pelagibacterium montanilacus TaxID=2185280 RepID=UPI000F8D88F7|nr:ABC transporter ATP-binding protein [Pelagibacterium montanilacus]
MARIELKDINKSFGEHQAVKGLDMTIEDGELLVLLGPSGCGKSTTMNMIAGLEDASSGQILFNGRDVTDIAPFERNVAMVFQSSLLYPHLTARKNIRMSLKRTKLSSAEIDKRVEDAATTVDVTHLLDKFPAHLSGGERQRVATAKAIVRQPDCFLLDEPLSALDAALRLSLRSELVNLQKRLHTTMIFVTHDQVEAMTMGDRIGVMRDGRLEQIGSPTDIYNEPQTLFVAGFVGAPPMNFFDGAIEETATGKVFANADMRVPLTGSAAELDPRARVVLAIRPHLMELCEEGPESVPLKVYAIEQLGNEAIVVCDGPNDNRIRVVVAPGYSAQIGSTIHARFNADVAHFFDPATERVIPKLTKAAA